MSRPREPWRRERLLDAAAEVMRNRGVNDLKVVDIAAAAGVSTGTIHYHFDDIEGVLLGVIERAFDQMYHQRLAAITPLESIPHKLHRLIELGIPDGSTPELAMMYEGIAVMRTRPRFAPLTRSYVERQVGLYRSVLDAGVFTGDFQPNGDTDSIARNLLALEDAYDMYVVLGVISNGQIARANVVTYAELALSVELPK
jgi:AcrR family transcriptional regulator